MISDMIRYLLIMTHDSFGIMMYFSLIFRL